MDELRAFHRTHHQWRACRRLVVEATAALLMCAEAASAQTEPGRPALVGPVSLYPSIVLRDIGIDSNIRNEADHAKEDFTLTAQPRLRAVAPFGPALWTGSATVGLVYYAVYKDEQSINRLFESRIEGTRGRLRPFLAATLNQTRERSGYEIDARVFRQDVAIGGGAELKLTGVTSLTGAYRRSMQNFADDERFLGTVLGEQLDYTSDVARAGARLSITPLTTVLVDLEVQRDRFAHSEIRDADSVRVMPAVEFAPDAAIAGRVAAGFRRFSPRNPRIDEFRGVVVSANAVTTLMGATRLAIDATRDVMYSFDPVTPFFVVTAERLTVTQRIGGPFHLVVTAGQDRLRYTGFADLPTDRVDRTRTGGGGVGFRLGESLWLTVIYDVTDRTSSRLERREYNRRRLFASATYGV